MSNGIRPSDIKEFEFKLSSYLVKLKKQGKITNREIAEDILGESDLEVPKKTGTLASTQFIEEVNDSRGTVKFGYGGSNAKVNPSGTSTDDYMVRMHEDLGVNHTNGKAKFLMDPFIRNISNIKVKQARGLGKVRP